MYSTIQTGEKAPFQVFVCHIQCLWSRGEIPHCFLHVFPHESLFVGYLYNLVGYVLNRDTIMPP